ncbi:MAG: biotin/lipoyl-binding protein, partial [Lachnospiraceae bacterium]|nr:biotin/lipoyl-binding protein [Lachnospiraceae bacterium]
MRQSTDVRKKIIIGIVVTLVVFGGIIGAIYAAAASNRGEVLVIPVKQADYGTNDEYDNVTDGVISTGTSQTITYDSSKLVEEIPVHEGDHVNKGDVLVRYDTMQARLNVAQKELDIRIAQNDLKEAEDELASLKVVHQVFVPDEVEEEDEEDEDDEEETDEDEEDADDEAGSDEDEKEDSEDDEEVYDGREVREKKTTGSTDSSNKDSVKYQVVEVAKEEPVGEAVPNTSTGSSQEEPVGEAVPNTSGTNTST